MSEGRCQCGHTFSWHGYACLASGCKCQKSFAELLTEENETLRKQRDDLRTAAIALINYRNRNSALTFQLEKLDDYINLLGIAVAKSSELEMESER